MPDATYVGAGMPCGNCGNPLTLGQPHKCGRTPDQPRDDGTHGTRWLAGKLPPDKEVVLAHHYDDLLAAALPDERLREADRKVILEWAKFTRDESAGYWGRREEDVYQRLLAAADREAPDECRAPHCWYEYGTPCGTCPVAPPVSDEQEKP